MSRRTSPPFRADHVGSLLRPRLLLQARDDFAAGRITAADLRSVEDQEIPKAVRMQEEVGLQSATDGEWRRTTWHMDFIYALGGISKAPGNLAVKFRNPSGTIEWTPAALHVGSKVRLDGTIFGEDFTFLQAHVTTAVPKLTIPPATNPSISQQASRPVRSRMRRTAGPGRRMTGRRPSGSHSPAPAISRAEPQSMKPVPARSKTSRPGSSRETSVSCSARNGIVTRSSSPLMKIVAAPGADSTSIMTRPVRGPSCTAASASGRFGDLVPSAAALFGPLISGAPAGDGGRARCG